MVLTKQNTSPGYVVSHTFRDRLATATDSSVGKEILGGQLGGGINNLYCSKHVLAKERMLQNKHFLYKLDVFHIVLCKFY